MNKRTFVEHYYNILLTTALQIRDVDYTILVCAL